MTQGVVIGQNARLSDITYWNLSSDGTLMDRFGVELAAVVVCGIRTMQSGDGRLI